MEGRSAGSQPDEESAREAGEAAHTPHPVEPITRFLNKLRGWPQAACTRGARAEGTRVCSVSPEESRAGPEPSPPALQGPTAGSLPERAGGIQRAGAPRNQPQAGRPSLRPVSEPAGSAGCRDTPGSCVPPPSPHAPSHRVAGPLRWLPLGTFCCLTPPCPPHGGPCQGEQRLHSGRPGGQTHSLLSGVRPPPHGGADVRAPHSSLHAHNTQS